MIITIKIMMTTIFMRQISSCQNQAKEAETRIAADGTTEIILTPVNEVLIIMMMMVMVIVVVVIMMMMMVVVEVINQNKV